MSKRKKHNWPELIKVQESSGDTVITNDIKQLKMALLSGIQSISSTTTGKYAYHWPQGSLRADL